MEYCSAIKKESNTGTFYNIDKLWQVKEVRHNGLHNL